MTNNSIRIDLADRFKQCWKGSVKKHPHKKESISSRGTAMLIMHTNIHSIIRDFKRFMIKVPGIECPYTYE